MLRTTLPLALLACLASTVARPLPAQTSTHDLLERGVAASEKGKAALEGFTYFDLEHNQNRDAKGKLFLDRTFLYEETSIADLPYRRLVEIDGKPLAGKDLAKEQERYDKAVADRKGLGTAARAGLLHQKLVEADLHLDQTLTSAYRLTELRQETLDGEVTHVIEAVPDPGANPVPTKQLQFWVADTDAIILRLTFDVLADEPEMLHGSHGDITFERHDGLPLTRHQVFHLFYPHSGKMITVDTEHTFTRYRRFTATTHILSTTEAPQP